MPWKFNPFTGAFDYFEASSGGGSSDLGELSNQMLSGPSEDLSIDGYSLIELLFDENGNVLIGGG